MKDGQPLILLNSTEEQHPTYRALVQTDKELPGYDKGLDKIRYNAEGIKKAMPSLLGEDVWDTTSNGHDRNEGKSNSKRFGKVVKEGYCPNYGGYVDIEVYDPEYIPILNNMLDSVKRGLPLKTGFSTEIDNDYKAQKYGDNSVEITDWMFDGLVLANKPRDTTAQLCGVVLNSLETKLEDDILTDKIDVIELNKADYDAFKSKEQELEDLKPRYNDVLEKSKAGKEQYMKEQEEFIKLKAEKDALFEQLVPVWTKQGEQKAEMVNSILERIPEAEREDKKVDFEEMSVKQLGTIINTLPAAEPERGIQNGGVGSGRKPAEEDDIISEEDYYKGLGIKTKGDE
jgi:hypothetical protein